MAGIIETVKVDPGDVLGFALMAQLGPYAAFLSVRGSSPPRWREYVESAHRRDAPAGRAMAGYGDDPPPNERERDRVLERLEGSGQAAQDDAGDVDT